MDERLVAAYDYELPASLIAQAPAARRDDARLMVLRGWSEEDRCFADLPDLLEPGDLLVLNETRVIAARLHARRESGGKVEILLLHPASFARYDPQERLWSALLRPAKRLRVGEHVRVVGDEDEILGEAVVTAMHGAGIGEVRLEIHDDFEAFLARAGRLALPPYIHNDSEEAQERYQTIFARVPGSVAAPTAALHFTSELFTRLAERGIATAKLTLDVGLGTFRPMQGEHLDEHEMHAEHYTIEAESVRRILDTRAAGRRVIAVGTTVVRALEGNARERGSLCAGEFTTSLFITPGYEFRVVDAMITNFHLPRSTLLVLVSTFAGRERILRAYEEAMARGYRFYSFGDAMLILSRSDRARGIA